MITVKELKALLNSYNDNATVAFVTSVDDNPFDYYDINEIVAVQGKNENLVVFYPE